MTLSQGSRLGSYEVAAQVGVGGMGEVYRARDTRLGREVAIKVLPEDFATDQERLSRFEREARSLAALSHPNVATLYSFEQEGDTHFLVMELVEGEDLTERVARGPISYREAIPLLVQIAEGLEEAHARGIIHRDLKPGNIKVTADGRVKLLDFGLAKELARVTGAGADLSHSPTMTAATQYGVLLGTAAYMSPEQARGMAVDRRADIWAFGAIAFEMLCGRMAFDGSDVSSILASVLRDDPDWTQLPQPLPRPIERLLRRCLTRDPRQRLHDIADARLDLEEALEERLGEAEGSSLESGSAGSSSSAPFGPSVVLSILAALLLGALGGLWVGRATGARPAESPATRFTVALPEGASLGPTGYGTPLALSPDGTSLVFQAELEGGARQLFGRSLDGFESQPIPGTEGATTPFFSPDGAWLGFWADGEIRKTNLRGGSPITILRVVGNLSGADWTDDDTIYFGTGLGGGIFRVSADGGEARVVAELAQSDIIYGDPQLLVGGEWLLYDKSDGTSRVAIAALPDGPSRTLIEGGSAQLLGTDRLLFSQGGALRVAPFDLDRGELRGTPIPLLDGLDYQGLGGLQTGALALSDQGTLAYGVLRGPRFTRLTWLGGDDQFRSMSPQPEAEYYHPRLAPDGSRLATSVGHQGIWTIDVDTGVAQPVWQEGAAYQPRFTPDGQHLVIKLNGNLVVIAADGSGTSELLLDRPGYLTPFSFSPNGDLALTEGYGSGSNILILSPDGEVRAFRESAATDTNPEFSPDGRWLLYVSDVAGTPDVYMTAVDGQGGQCAVTSGGATAPAWSSDGRRIYYLREGALWVTRLVGRGCRTEDALLVYDRTPVDSTAHSRSYDVLPNGEGVVLIDQTPMVEARAREIHVVVDWLDELEAREVRE